MTIGLSLIAFVAAIVNGALGYGFSSVAVPLALLFVGSRELNPALVVLELGLNGYVLWSSQAALPRVWRRSVFIVAGLVPGIALGTAALTHVEQDRLRLAAFVVLLPLILLQTAGYRRPVRSRRAAGVVFGTGLGTLYAATTISGPPLAMFLNNEGYTKREFHAALGLVRFAESTFGAMIYWNAGLLTAVSTSTVAWILPSVAVGLPVGTALVRRIDAETFRRVSMSFNAAIVAFGIATSLRALQVPGGVAYLPFAGVLAFVVATLYGYRRPVA
jgi:uncharacterized membrane protein YfcA